MRAVDVIRKKRDGHTLTEAEIEAFVQAATHHHWPEYQLSALLMAIVLRGMDEQETFALTRAMVHSGVKLDLSSIPGHKGDKHSTGGVGDKTSLILAPLASACGVIVPMMSGRGLGHTGGTLDKLESIPGFRVGLSLEELRASLAHVGCALIGQTKEIAPADRVLYALRDVTGTVESLPLIASSIMSKKIAEGIRSLVIDVKCGKGAFLKTREEADRMARTLVAIGREQHVRVRALVTRMDAPLGQAVGNSLEVIESLEILKGRGPTDLTNLSVLLAAHMVQLADLAPSLAEAEQKVWDSLASGKGLEKLRQIIVNQGGEPAVIDDYSRLPTAPHRRSVNASRSGFAGAFDAEKVGQAAMVLGAGRDRAEENVDHAVGAMLLVKPGDRVQTGQPILELHYREEARMKRALPLLVEACPILDEPLALGSLVLETIE